MERPDLFSYLNFRELLSDFYDFYHTEDKAFTKSHICKMIGLPNSRSYFKDILNGKILSAVKIPLMASVFRLNSKETHYFRLLVQYNQSADLTEKEFLFNQVMKLNSIQSHKLSQDQYEYYNKWYYPVLRALLSIVKISSISGCESLIKKILVIPMKSNEISKAVCTLDKLGIIKKDDDSYYKPTNNVISTGKNANETIKMFQLKQLDIARQLCIAPHTNVNEVRTKILTISESGLKKVEEQIELFNNEINTIVTQDSDSEEYVYQLNITFLPFTKRITNA